MANTFYYPQKQIDWKCCRLPSPTPKPAFEITRMQGMLRRSSYFIRSRFFRFESLNPVALACGDRNQIRCRRAKWVNEWRMDSSGRRKQSDSNYLTGLRSQMFKCNLCVWSHSTDSRRKDSSKKMSWSSEEALKWMACRLSSLAFSFGYRQQKYTHAHTSRHKPNEICHDFYVGLSVNERRT